MPHDYLDANGYVTDARLEDIANSYPPKSSIRAMALELMGRRVAEQVRAEALHKRTQAAEVTLGQYTHEHNPPPVGVQEQEVTSSWSMPESEPSAS